MDERIRRAVGDEPAWVVGGALRDELLGREIVDVDVACPNPELAARLYSRLAGGVVFPLSERHGAWRVAFRDGNTFDFTPLHGETIEEDLATRDFTVNALARPLGGGPLVDPFGGEADLAARRLRAVCESVFDDDPLRLLRAVRMEDELGFRLDEPTAELLRAASARVGEPAGERILGELERLSPDGFRRADELGLLDPLGGSVAGLERLDPADTPGFVLVAVFGEASGASPPPTSFASSPAPSWPRSARPTTRRGRSTASAAAPSRGRSPRSPSSARPTSTTRFEPRAPPTTPSRSCAVRTCSRSASSRARRSAACSSSSPRSARWGRSRLATRRSTSSAPSWAPARSARERAGPSRCRSRG